MPRSGIALRARAERIAANVRGAYEALDARVVTPTSSAPLAEVIPLCVPPPALEHPPTTRKVDDKGRVSVRLGGLGLDELMRWSPDPLDCHPDGAWVVLRPDAGAPCRRNEGSSRLGEDGRLRLPAATRRLLGVEPGEEVAVLALPDHDAVALCHSSHLVSRASLSLLHTVTASAGCGGGPP